MPFRALTKAVNCSFGINCNYTAFSTKFSPEGSTLARSTFLDGSGATVEPFGKVNQFIEDSGTGIAIDSRGNVYLTGMTYSSDVPITQDAFQNINKAAKFGDENAFVGKLSADGSSLLYSSFLGGTGNRSSTQQFQLSDAGAGIAVDTNGQRRYHRPYGFKRLSRYQGRFPGG
jgi:hypothetical protein